MFDLNQSPSNCEAIDPYETDHYHNGRGWRKRYMPTLEQKLERNFVVWDGEGITHGFAVSSKGSISQKPQDYVLFGCFNGTYHNFITAHSLTTIECLDFIMEQTKENPLAYHVSFAFGYDTNMILRSLSYPQIQLLKQNGYVRYRGYRIAHVSGKWLRISKDENTVTIFDTYGFFQSTLVRALKTHIPDHPDMVHLPEIESGKAKRGSFADNEMAEVEAYWKIENRLFHSLVFKLRKELYDVGLTITKWHGPGAIANFVYKTHQIADAKADLGPYIYDASRYAYAGGRFEMFRAGRFENVWSYDINSAYPYAIAQLPPLNVGVWRHREEIDSKLPIKKFGLYRIELKNSAFLLQKKPGPLFHRSATGHVTFPWRTIGWYWGPEVVNLKWGKIPFRIIEAWEYSGWEDSAPPFAFVEDMYEQRQAMETIAKGSGIALKLALNSLYGKMAQRAGWERTKGAPKWHQLEWAGWVTSYTRHLIYGMMLRTPFDNLIAAETDGVYTTLPPEHYGLTSSAKLGEWKINAYDEMTYLQSGVYAYHDTEGWHSKYRGLDARSLTAKSITEHARLLMPNELWPPIVGTTTRFVGYRQALMREGPFKVHHCRWETEKKEISCGSEGKRKHVPKLCNACAAGATAYEMPHDLVIEIQRSVLSYPHDIPWLEADRAEWRELHDADDEYIEP